MAKPIWQLGLGAILVIGGGMLAFSASVPAVLVIIFGVIMAIVGLFTIANR